MSCSVFPVLELEVEASLWLQGDQKILLDWPTLIQGDLKVPENVSQYHLLLIQSKLLPNAVPKEITCLSRDLVMML